MAAQPQPNEWLAAYARVQRLADRDILRLLDQSLKDTRRMLRALEKKSNIGAMVRAEQLRTIKRHMLAEQAKIFRKLGDIVSARRVEAAARAVALGTATDAALFSAIGDTARARALGEALSQGLAHSTEVAVTRMTQSSFPLAQRIYRTQAWMDGRVEAGINSALARGLSAKEFAREAEDWFNPNTPGGVRYAALRLARSEINNAFHAISVNSAMGKPWVHGMQWHLSSSHPKADVCDQYAHEDHSRLGAGVYKVEEVPRKPHPHCFCYVTPVLESEDAFIDNMFAGKYDAQISKIFAESAGQEPGRNIVASGLGALSAKSKIPARKVPSVRRSFNNARRGEDALDSVPLTTAHGLPTPGSLTGVQREFPAGVLSDEERRFLHQYRGTAYSNINEVLRRQRGDLPGTLGFDFYREATGAIDSAMARSTLRSDVLVFRGVKSGRAVFGEAWDGQMVGAEWTEWAYVSTTADEKVTRLFPGEVQRYQDPTKHATLRILARKGTHALGLSGSDYESEILLARGLRFRVISDTGPGPNRVIDVEVIG
jgi:hypothetical protein